MSQIGHGLSQIGRESGLRPVENPWYTAQLPVKTKVAGTFSWLRPLVRDLLPSSVYPGEGMDGDSTVVPFWPGKLFCGVKEISSQ